MLRAVPRWRGALLRLRIEHGLGTHEGAPPVGNLRRHRAASSSSSWCFRASRSHAVAGRRTWCPRRYAA